MVVFKQQTTAEEAAMIDQVRGEQYSPSRVSISRMAWMLPRAVTECWVPSGLV